MPLKDNIKKRRLELGLTLENVADYLGISKQTVQKYESGIVLNIPSDKIEKLAEILRTTPTALMGWTDDKPATDEGDGLTEDQKFLIKIAQKCDDEQAKRLRRLVEAGLDLGEK